MSQVLDKTQKAQAVLIYGELASDVSAVDDQDGTLSDLIHLIRGIGPHLSERARKWENEKGLRGKRSIST